MKLAEFILHDMEGILAEWEHFAGTLLPAAAGMTPLALRNDARDILEAVAHDVRQSQSREERVEKSRGRAPVAQGSPETSAQTHAVLRARHGFDIIQLVAEYRALRASVLRRWLDTVREGAAGVDEVIRFNEAIDQAVAESVGHFHAQVELSRNLMLGMLGHDMRSPLNTVLTTAAYLKRIDAGEPVAMAAARLERGGASMRALVDDLSTFSRTSLGLGINVVRSELDLAVAVGDEVEQLRGAHPRRRIELAASGDARGFWDGARLQQLVRNLVTNAIRYGDLHAPVRVSLRGDETDLWLEVANEGPGFDPARLAELFGPLKRGPHPERREDGDGGLGLGLYIVREIAQAHGGEVQARSDAGVTVFAVRLPRDPRVGAG